MDVNLLSDLEGSANKSDAVRQRIYDRADKVFNQIVQENNDEAEGIVNKTRYKPGGGIAVGTPAPAPSATPAPTAKPTLQQFMEKARAANPGAKDSELAQFWKQKYGG
jgi:hypothetical protein